tara:strand:+ start:59 stop:895 length:837 start_codon:yes stop_codon:yes gene_type:complete
MTTWTSEGTASSSSTPLKSSSMEVTGNISGGTISSTGLISTSGAITSTSWAAIGIATRTGSETLRLHGSTPSLKLTSVTNLEGGQVTIQGTNGDGLTGVDYTSNYMYIDMWKTNARFVFKGKNLTEQSAIKIAPDVQNDDSNNTRWDTKIHHNGPSSKAVISGSNLDSTDRDQLNIGEGAARDQVIVYDGNGADYYIGIDDTDDIFYIGTGSTAGSNKKIGVNSTGIGFHGAAPVAQSSAYTATTQNARNADTATTFNPLQDVVQTLIADLKATGIIG